MKYIFNTGRYAIAFTITKNDRPFKIALDKRRLYMDTGNVATTGITPVEEADIEELKKQSRFNKMIESGELSILEEKDIKSPEENKISKLEDENKELRDKLKKAENADIKEVEEKNQKLEDENKKLREQLEALGNKKSKGKEADEDKEADEADEDKEAKATDGF